MDSQSSQRQDLSHQVVGQPSVIRMRAFYQRLNELLSETSPNLERISDLLVAEASVGQQLLRTVNSTSTGLAHSVRSVRHAVTLLGAMRIRALLEPEFSRIELLSPVHEQPVTRDETKISTTPLEANGVNE